MRCFATSSYPCTHFAETLSRTATPWPAHSATCVDDDSSWLGLAFSVAPELAAELLDDGLARPAPEYQHR